jgi:hypothetical protein
MHTFLFQAIDSHVHGALGVVRAMGGNVTEIRPAGVVPAGGFLVTVGVADKSCEQSILEALEVLGLRVTLTS